MIALRQMIALLLALGVVAGSVSAQQKPAPPPPPKPATPATPQKPPPQKPTPPATPPSSTARQPSAQRRPITARGYGTFGGLLFSAKDSFETVFGGGIQALWPQGFFVDGGVSWFRREGERVFIAPNDEVFRLGIPLRVTITPIEITGGWRFVRRPAVARPPLRFGARPSRLVPYVGGGYSWLRYQETSDVPEEEDDVNEWFSGFHVLGGIEYRVRPRVTVGGEVKWSSIPDALGEGGTSAAFGEDNLGGTTFRVKVSFGR
jgi:hypothetical protein